MASQVFTICWFEIFFPLFISCVNLLCRFECSDLFLITLLCIECFNDIRIVEYVIFKKNFQNNLFTFDIDVILIALLCCCTNLAKGNFLYAYSCILDKYNHY